MADLGGKSVADYAADLASGQNHIGPAQLASGWLFLAPAATINTDAATGSNFKIGPNQAFHLANPTNPKDGQVIAWRVAQPGAGGPFAITYGAAFRWPGGVPFALTAAPNAVDKIVAQYCAFEGVWEAQGLPDIK